MNEAHVNIVIGWIAKLKFTTSRNPTFPVLHLEASSREEMSKLLDEYVPYLLKENNMRIHISASTDEHECETRQMRMNTIAEVAFGPCGRTIRGLLNGLNPLSTLNYNP